jgi:hypothetical protein
MVADLNSTDWHPRPHGVARAALEGGKAGIQWAWHSRPFEKTEKPTIRPRKGPTSQEMPLDAPQNVALVRFGWARQGADGRADRPLAAAVTW